MAEDKKTEENKEEQNTIYHRIEECAGNPKEARDYCWLNPDLAVKNYAMCPFRGKQVMITTKTEKTGLLGILHLETTKEKFECLKSIDMEKEIKVKEADNQYDRR